MRNGSEFRVSGSGLFEISVEDSKPETRNGELLVFQIKPEAFRLAFYHLRIAFQRVDLFLKGEVLVLKVLDPVR